MRLDIDENVFVNGVDIDEVLTLLRLITSGRHEWRPEISVAVRAEQFLATHAPHLTLLAQKLVEESVNPSPSTDVPARVTAAELKAVVADLAHAAVLVVEDEITESCFLSAIAVAFGQAEVAEAIDRCWLDVRHAGGKDRMEQFVERRRRLFSVLVRVAALLDSDQDNAAHRTRNHTVAERIRAIDGMREVHMWGCRELENYVPDRVWEHHFRDRAEKVAQLRQMIPAQRRYLDVKRHFVGKNGSMPKPLIPEQMRLTEDDFAELGPEVVAELRELLAMIRRIL